MSYILDGQEHPWILYTRSQEQTQYTDKKHLQIWSNIAWCWGGGWDAGAEWRLAKSHCSRDSGKTDLHHLGLLCDIIIQTEQLS